MTAPGSWGPRWLRRLRVYPRRPASMHRVNGCPGCSRTSSLRCWVRLRYQAVICIFPLLETEAWVGDELLTGRYDIRGLLERDETDERWLAVDLAMRRPVVIWLSQPGRRIRVPDGKPAHGRLPVAGVVHPNVLRMYDAGRAADGRDYLVTEFVEGTDLAALVRTRGPLPGAQVADVAVQTGARFGGRPCDWGRARPRGASSPATDRQRQREDHRAVQRTHGGPRHRPAGRPVIRPTSHRSARPDNRRAPRATGTASVVCSISSWSDGRLSPATPSRCRRRRSAYP